MRKNLEKELITFSMQAVKSRKRKSRESRILSTKFIREFYLNIVFFGAD